MHRPINKILFLLIAILLCHLKSKAAEKFVSFNSSDVYDMPLLTGTNDVFSIYCDDNECEGIKIAIQNLCSDFKRVGNVIPAQTSKKRRDVRIMVGTLDGSPLVRELACGGHFGIKELEGKNEKYIISRVKDPECNDGNDVLLIAGSDRRGAIYGIYELSRQIGVSPWYWWADAPVAKHSKIFVKKGSFTDGEPAVRYRGIFINDEEPSFGSWCRNHFGGYNSKMYEKLFELLLRLKANYLWPAMWNSAFNETDTLNPVIADKMGIIMGTSHHEPMMRAHKEYTSRRNEVGPWDYSTNKDGLDKFFHEGLQRNGGFENMITIGMRGDGDVAMGKGDDSDNMKTLANVIKGQRDIIEDVYKKPASAVPQVWAIFTEVQRYYDAGFTVPDDVTLMFCDNNWGYIRRTGPIKERNRKGGMGLYYHIDMNGGPWNDRWINTTTVPKLREQLNLAYRTGLDDLWIINVGDLKPKEYPISFIMEYAWNPDNYPAGSEHGFTYNWAASIFSEEYAEDIAKLIEGYSNLNLMRKPEVQSTKIFSLVNHKEAEHQLDAWHDLVSRAENLNVNLPTEMRDAYYQLVYYPVLASAGVAEIYLMAARNNMYAAQGRVSANDCKKRVCELFERDSLLSLHYNKNVAAGKWDGMMQDVHIGYSKWYMPKYNSLPPLSEVIPSQKSALGVTVEGTENAWPGTTESAQLPTFDFINPIEHYIEVFNRGNVKAECRLKTNKKWITLPKKKFVVDSDMRIPVNINWQMLGEGSHEGIITVSDGSMVVDIQVKAIKHPIEHNGSYYGTFAGEYSIPADGFNKNIAGAGASWIKLPGLGREGTCMGIDNVNAPSSTILSAPRLEYDMLLPREGNARICVGILPTQDINPARGLRIAVGIDDDDPIEIDARKGMVDTFGEYNPSNLKLSKVLKPLPSTKYQVALSGNGLYCRNEVFDNLRWLDVELPCNEAGIHTLKIYMVDPEIVVERIVVNPDDSIPSYNGAPVVCHK